MSYSLKAKKDIQKNKCDYNIWSILFGKSSETVNAKKLKKNKHLRVPNIPDMKIKQQDSSPTMISIKDALGLFGTSLQQTNNKYKSLNNTAKNYDLSNIDTKCVAKLVDYVEKCQVHIKKINKLLNKMINRFNINDNDFNNIDTQSDISQFTDTNSIVMHKHGYYSTNKNAITSRNSTDNNGSNHNNGSFNYDYSKIHLDSAFDPFNTDTNEHQTVISKIPKTPKTPQTPNYGSNGQPLYPIKSDNTNDTRGSEIRNPYVIPKEAQKIIRRYSMSSNAGSNDHDLFTTNPNNFNIPDLTANINDDDNDLGNNNSNDSTKSTTSSTSDEQKQSMPLIINGFQKSKLDILYSTPLETETNADKNIDRHTTQL